MDITIRSLAYFEKSLSIAITESRSNDLKYFPNPAESTVTIQVKDLDEFELVEIFDLSGVRYNLDISQEGSEFEIDISNVPSGIVFIRTHYKGKIDTKKIIKN